MAHDHAHGHGDTNSYYIEQLFTIAVCGAIGGVMVLLCVSGRIRYLLNETQHMRVLLGGAGLVAIVLIRAVYLWIAVGQKKPAGMAQDHAHDDCGHAHGDCGHEHNHEHHHHHEHAHEAGIKVAASSALASLPLAAPTVPTLAHTHDHDHGHDHDHSHAHAHDHHHHHGHDHDHDHDHGWAPWRFMLLLLPVILFFLGLPNDGIRAGKDISKRSAEEEKELANFESKNGGNEKAKTLSFLDLEKASMNVNVRDEFEGRLVNVTGQYLGTDPHRFTLQRFKINCCAADAIPLNAVIMINPADQKKYELNPGQYQGKWVSVTGRIHFVRSPNGEYLTAIFIHPTKDDPVAKLVEIVPAENISNPYAS